MNEEMAAESQLASCVVVPSLFIFTSRLVAHVFVLVNICCINSSVCSVVYMERERERKEQ